MSSEVFSRTGEDTMSRRSFYFVMGVVLAWGFVLTAMLASVSATWQLNTLHLIVLCAITFVGVFMTWNDNALVSFVGFNMISGGFGVLLGPALAMADVKEPGLVESTAWLTAGVTAVMALSGVLFPNFYSKIGGILFGALLCLVAVAIAQIFIPQLRELNFINWAGAGIFALWVGYDMWRASDIPATLDNAVDTAASLYLDVLNLFLYLLKARAGSDD